MTPVRLVVFQAPIPIPSTQRREPLFDADDGWTIECHGDGVFRIAGHGADFFTDGFVSWVPMPPPATLEGAQGAFKTMEAAAVDTVKRMESEESPIPKMARKRAR